MKYIQIERGCDEGSVEKRKPYLWLQEIKREGENAIGETKLSYIYDDCIPDDYDEEETVCCRSSDASVKRYRDERYKRKVSNIIRRHHHIFCPYGDSHTKRYALWRAWSLSERLE